MGKVKGNNKKKGKQRQTKTVNGAPPKRTSGADPDENEGVFSLYRRYKEATQRAKNILHSLAPSKFRNDLVHNFVEAADFIVQKGKPLEEKRQLLSDLKVAINFRKKYSSQFHEGGDEGHTYFVSVLNYCYHTLKVCPSTETDDPSTKREGTKSVEGPHLETGKFSNMFAALTVDDEEGDKDNINDLDASEEVQRPGAPEKPYDLSYYLGSIPESIHALRFFELLDLLLGRVEYVLKGLKDKMVDLRNGDINEGVVLHWLVSLGIIANRHLEQVQRLESTITLECPTLNSIYRILASAHLSVYIRLISDDVRKHSPIRKRFSDDMTLALMANLIESVFQGHLYDRGKTIVTNFCTRWRLPPAIFRQIEYFGCRILVSIERDTATLLEKKLRTEFDESFCLPERKWLGDYHFLSGDRSFLNTLKMLDLFRSQYVSWIGAFESLPPLWHETENLASAIRGDMDLTITKPIFMFFMTSLDRPPVVNEKELLPLFHLFRQWHPQLRHPQHYFEGREPLTFSHAFAAHMMTLSLLEVQGDGDVAHITQIAHSYATKHIDQMSRLMNSDTSGSRNKYSELISSLKGLLNFEPTAEAKSNIMTKLLDREDDYRKCEQITIWNPVCSAMIVQYIMFGPSFDEGCGFMDLCTQTRVSLHLFNALKQRGLVDKDLPVISTVDHYFCPCKAIWNGWGKPEQGKFTYRFFLCLGFDHKSSLKKQDDVKFLHCSGTRPDSNNRKASLVHNLSRGRVNMIINLREASTAYTTVVLQDYRGTRVQTLDPTRATPMEIQDLDMRMAEDLKSTAKEDDLLQMNLFAVGDLFNRFVDEIFPSNESLISTLLGSTGGSAEVARMYEILALTEKTFGMLDYLDDHHFVDLSKQFEDFFRGIQLKNIRLDMP